MNEFTLGRGLTSAKYVEPPSSGYHLYRLYPTVLSRAQERGIVPTMRLESFEKEQKLYFCLHIFPSTAVLRIAISRKELWTEVISGYSNDADMRWSPEQIREFHIDLQGNAPIAPCTCNSYQNQDTHSRSEEIVTNMATWDVSTARTAAATMHQEAVTSSRTTCIHPNSLLEEKKEATSGI